jgi:hypothetical protein
VKVINREDPDGVEHDSVGHVIVNISCCQQGLQLQESVVDRLQTVERRWNGVADVALSRLRGGLAESMHFIAADL